MKYSSYFLCFLAISLAHTQAQAGASRGGPKEVSQEIKQLRTSISQELVSQLLEFAVKAARRHSTLRRELSSFLPQEIQNSTCDADLLAHLEQLHHLSPEQKEHIIRSLSEETKVALGNFLASRLNSNIDAPFRIPQGTQTISQLDTFFLLVITLFDQDSRYIPLCQALETCYGIKDALKIKTRLNTSEVNALLPESFKNNFFTQDFGKLMMISQRIQKLALTYA